MSLQHEFDKTYISSTEICQRLGIHRSTVFNGAKAGKLPDCIIIRRLDGSAHIMLWMRAQAEPMLDAWAKEIASRKAR